MGLQLRTSQIMLLISRGVEVRSQSKRRLAKHAILGVVKHIPKMGFSPDLKDYLRLILPLNKGLLALAFFFKLLVSKCGKVLVFCQVIHR